MNSFAKNTLTTGNLPNSASLALLLLRLAVGTFMLTHGAGKMATLFSGDPIRFADPIGIGATASLALIVFAEVFCSILLILGLVTRFSAIPPLVGMLVAAFIVHGQDPFGNRELALFYSVIYLVLILTGAGKFSIDYLLWPNKGKR